MPRNATQTRAYSSADGAMQTERPSRPTAAKERRCRGAWPPLPPNASCGCSGAHWWLPPLQDELTKARKALAAEAEQKRILVSLSDRRRRRRGSTVRCMVNCVWGVLRVRCMCIAHCVTLIALMIMCRTLRRIDASPVVHRVHSSAGSSQPCVFAVDAAARPLRSCRGSRRTGARSSRALQTSASRSSTTSRRRS
jgi:hypothetical protein